MKDKATYPYAGQRILMVTSVFPRYAGDATPGFVLNQARALVKEGCRVLVLAPHGAGACWNEQVDGVEVARFPYFLPLRLQLLCYDGGMLVNFRHRPWTKCLLPFFAVSEFLALVWQVVRFRPSIIHSHSLLPQSWIAGMVADSFDLPHVATSHGNDVFGLKKTGLMGWLKRRAIRCADLVTANSVATRAALRELGCPEEKVRLVPSVPGGVSDQTRALEFKREPYRVCFVGRLIEEKGVADLLRAFAIVARSLPQGRLRIAGEGQDAEGFKALAKELGIESCCDWLGWLPQDAVHSEMRRARVVVVPSREIDSGWTEAQGLVVAEAMLAGATLVASRTGGIVDMVTDGATGRLAASGDPVSLSEVLLSVLENQGTAERLALAGEHFAGERFSTPAVARLMGRVYLEVGR